MRQETLKEGVLRLVSDWFDRASIRVRDTLEPAKIELTLSDPSGDDDGSLWLVLNVEEKHLLGTDGPVPGVPFETEEETDGEKDD